MKDYCSWKFKYWNEWLLNVFKKGINCLRNQTPWVSNAEIIILMVTQRFSCNCTNTAREKKEKQGLEEERGSESETRASSGPVSLKSWPVAFCHDTPFAGLFKSGQARKTAGHKLQATDELITNVHYLTVWQLGCIQTSSSLPGKEWEEKSSMTEIHFTKQFRWLILKGSCSKI